MTEVITPGDRPYSLSLKEGWRRFVDDPPRSQPRRLTVKEIVAFGPRERLCYEDERAVWHANLGPIATPQMTSVHEDLWQIIESNRQDGDKVKSAAVIDAYPGLGKTTIATRFGAEVDRRQMTLYGPRTADGHERIPVAYVALSANTTRRSFGVHLARFYGHPGAERGNADRISNHAADCIFSTDTRLVIVDDVHFLDMNRRDGREVANHFKWMANTFPVTFLFVGVGLAARGLFTEGNSLGDMQLAQTGRRWTPLGVSPFEIETDEGRQTWRRLLLGIERLLVLAETRQGMVADDLAEYLFARSTGHFASLMTLIARGCHRAIRTGDEKLTTEVLDHVKNDAAAERARTELLAAFESGRLTARVRSRAPRRRAAAECVA